MVRLRFLLSPIWTLESEPHEPHVEHVKRIFEKITKSGFKLIEENANSFKIRNEIFGPDK